MSTKRTIGTNYIDGISSKPNYIYNGQATYASTSGWSTYANTAASSPTTGTGGSPSVTISTSASSPLSGDNSFLLVKDAANRQGQGWSYAFSIDSAQQAKVLNISLDYLVSSGTFVAGTPTIDSDVTIWVYDVTNAQVIQPSGYKLSSNGATLSANFSGSFQTAANSTSYRLIMHVSTTSASAYTLKVDNVSVNQSQTSSGAIVSDWIAYTPTITSVGTATNVSFFWRRNSQNMEVKGFFNAGTTTAAVSTISLPSGFSMDAAKLGINNTSANPGALVGQLQTGANGGYQANVLTAPATNATVVYLNSVGSTATLTPNASNVNTFVLTSSSVSLNFSVPISGWDSVSSGATTSDSGVVSASYYASANGVASTTQTINFDTKLYDTHGAVTASAAGTGTWKFTAPYYGFYQITGALYTTGTNFPWTVYKNGTAFALIDTFDNITGQTNGSYTIQLNAGDYIDLRFNSSNTYGGNASKSTNGVSSIQITKVPATLNVSPSDTIAASAYGVPAGSSAGQPIIIPTKISDTHGAYNAATGRYTCPLAGWYQISLKAAYGSATGNDTVFVYKNASVTTTLLDMIAASSGGVFLISGSAIIEANAGDILDVRPTSSTASSGIAGGFSINRIK